MNPVPRKQASTLNSPELFQSQLSPLLSFNRAFSNNLYNQLLHSNSYKRNTNAEIQFFAPLKNDLFADLAYLFLLLPFRTTKEASIKFFFLEFLKPYRQTKRSEDRDWNGQSVCSFVIGEKASSRTSATIAKRNGLVESVVQEAFFS
jgi:hypothetical protein